jgi:hypothetical protein
MAVGCSRSIAMVETHNWRCCFLLSINRCYWEWFDHAMLRGWWYSVIWLLMSTFAVISYSAMNSFAWILGRTKWSQSQSEVKLTRDVLDGLCAPRGSSRPAVETPKYLFATLLKSGAEQTPILLCQNQWINVCLNAALLVNMELEKYGECSKLLGPGPLLHIRIEILRHNAIIKVSRLHPRYPIVHHSFSMPASTSTLTTSRPDNDNGASTRLRTSPPPTKETAPPLEIKENDFFWTYTEEPHRTRRQAIIKAHPEVTSKP